MSQTVTLLQPGAIQYAPKALDEKPVIIGWSPVSDEWSLSSWQSKPAAQAVVYEDSVALQRVCETLQQLPPLVSADEVERARYHFYDVAVGKSFMIQGGDCAESFVDVRYDVIQRKVELLHRQGQLLEAALHKPVVRVGRIAGQYAKPRSNPFETLASGQVVHAFRGHIINSEDEHHRSPDPSRLLQGYFHAATSHTAIRHLAACGGDRAPIYTSHEALHLPYEASLSRQDYNLSATTIWLGERTRQLDGAHVEYARGLRNPIGVKLGPSATGEEVIELLDALCPERSPPGKIILITRLGNGKVRSVLPALIRAVQLSGHVPIWLSDPCHANTWTTSEGRKTRRSRDMLAELQETYAVHQSLGNHLGGIHLEQTGDQVTECLDETHVLHPAQLGDCYTSLCDPRLSADQALDLVERFAKFVAG